MADILVAAENVSKKFCRSLKRSLSYGVRDLANEVTGRNGRHGELRTDEFWAVKDVSFLLERGQTLGIIGHNGAGKTTLLRMLNGLIKPDVGRIEIRGHMRALIALGVGFNPVLTGRENVYINAAVLGIPKAEMDRRFDQIVEFSGISEFIDMPVQSYSSGMTVRLGFSVAAHLEPDILLVDEVLAVGDLAFRTKCQVRIQELRDCGVAIILVSHNLHTISHICSRAITLERGRVIYDGDTERAIDAYRASLIRSNQTMADSIRAGTGEIRIVGVEVLNEAGFEPQDFSVGSFARIRIRYEALQPVHSPVFNLVIHLLNGPQVTGIRTDVDGLQLDTLQQGEGIAEIVIPHLNLLPNVYVIDAIIFHKDGVTFYDRVNAIAHLRVAGGLLVNGMAYLPHGWTMNGRHYIQAQASPEILSLTDAEAAR